MSDLTGQCLSALEALHQHPDPTVKKQADLWLIQFQNEKSAWMVADQILHRHGIKEEAYLFATNALLNKLQYSLNELEDPSQRAAFRSSLTSHAARFANASTPLIRSKLAQCVACLAVHLVGLGEWPNAIGELVNAFGNDAKAALMLLDILTFLPEENHNPKLFILATTRVRAQRELTKDTEEIVKLLLRFLASSTQTVDANGQRTDYISSGILHTPNAGQGAILLPHVSGVQKEMHTKILATFLAWVKASGENRQFLAPPGMPPAPANAILSSENLVQHPLVLFCFKIIASKCDELEQIAIDVLCSFLQNFNLVSRSLRGGFRGFQSASQLAEEEEYYAEADAYEQEEGELNGQEGQWSQGSFAPRNQQPGNQYQHMYFMRFMVSRILELVPLFDTLPPPQGPLSEHEDDHTAIARWYGRLFGEMAEYYLDFLMEFCLGVEGFSETLDPDSLNNLRAIVLHNTQQQALKSGQQPPQQLHPGVLEEVVQSNQKLVGSIIDIVLKCASHPRREVNSKVLFFFFLLSDALNAPVDPGVSRKVRQQKDAGGVTLLQIRGKRKIALSPAFQQLIPLLHRMIVYPPEFQPPGSNQPSTLSPESLEEIDGIRDQAGSTLIEADRVLGTESIMEVFVGDAVMGAQLQSFLADRSRWRELEASLYCVYRLGYRLFGAMDEDRRVQSSDVFQAGGRVHTQFIPKVFDLLLADNSPLKEVQPLRSATLRIMSCYSLWIKEYVRFLASQPQPPNTPDYLSRVLGVVIGGLQDPLVCKLAARALSVICEDNRVRLANNAQPNYLIPLMQVYNSCCVIPVVGKGTNAAGMTLDDQLKIINGIAAVVSCVNPGDPSQPGSTSNQVPHYLRQLTGPMVNEMQKILTQVQQMQPGPNGEYNLPPDVSFALQGHLERLAETIAWISPSLNPNREYFIQCLLDLYQTYLVPVLYPIMQHLANDENRMDKLGRVIKHVIRTTRLEFFTHCLQPLMHQLSASFARYPHPSFLYLLATCISHFGMHPDFRPVLEQLLPAFMERCIQKIPNTQAMAMDPDMTEDFFITARKLLEKCPEVLFRLKILPQMIESGIQGLFVQHEMSFKAVCHFLGNFIWHGISTPEADRNRTGPIVQQHVEVVQQCLQHYGPMLCDTLIQCIVGAIPRRHVTIIGSLMEPLLLFSRDASRPWFIAALQKIPDTADPTKQEFLDAIYSFKQSVFRMNLERFADASRIKREPAQ